MKTYVTLSTRLTNIDTTHLYRDAKKIKPNIHYAFDRLFYRPKPSDGFLTKADENQREFYEVVKSSTAVVANLIEVRICKIKGIDVVNFVGQYTCSEEQKKTMQQLKFLKRYLKDQERFVLSDNLLPRNKIPLIDIDTL